MATDCTRCGAATAAHMLTYIGTFRREDGRNGRATALCPACLAQWRASEEAAAISLETHAGGPDRPGRREATNG